MRESLERASAETSGVGMYLLAAYYYLANNFSIVLVLMGIGTMFVGATVFNGVPANPLEHHVLAGMMGVWGASLIFLGVLIYGIFWANKMYARLTSDSDSDAAPDADSASDSESGTDLSL